MSKEQSPAFQYYPRDILSDINYQAMTWAERGMYHHLMDICWIETFIPDDPAILARVLCISEEEFSEAWKVIGKCFKGGSKNGQLVHPRLDIERAKQAQWREKSSRGGKLSAHKRKNQKAKVPQQGGCPLVGTKGQPKVNSSSSSSSSNNNLSNDRLLDGATLPTPAAEVFTELPCTGKTQSWPVTKSYIAEMAPLYPGIDIEAEILRAKGWLLNNPTRRKTSVGMTRFLGSWFAREQDKARSPTLPVRVAPDLRVGESNQSSMREDMRQSLIAIECEEDPARKAELLADYKRKYETESEVA